MLIFAVPCESGMASPLMGVAAVNSLLFTSFAVSKRILSPYPNLEIHQIAAAGGMAGGVNALLASPVEMFKVKEKKRMVNGLHAPHLSHFADTRLVDPTGPHASTVRLTDRQNVAHRRFGYLE